MNDETKKSILTQITLSDFYVQKAITDLEKTGKAYIKLAEKLKTTHWYLIDVYEKLTNQE